MFIAHNTRDREIFGSFPYESKFVRIAENQPFENQPFNHTYRLGSNDRLGLDDRSVDRTIHRLIHCAHNRRHVAFVNVFSASKMTHSCRPNTDSNIGLSTLGTVSSLR
jgi:hypothetical protein